MAYQFLNPAPVFFTLLGLEPAAGGTLTFYEKGTTTLKATYSDEDLSIPNANPVQLDSAGRSNTHIWLDGDYTVLLKEASGASVWTRDQTSGQGAGATIPDLVNGQFLTNNGTDLLWAAIRQVPDPTGSANRILSTDGANLIWIPQPEIPEPPDPDIEVIETSGSLTSFQAGLSDDPAKFFIQVGSASAPATGTNQTSASITFPVPFAATPKVIPIPTTDTSGGGYMPIPGVTSESPTSATIKFETNAGQVTSGRIVNPVPFHWIAIGVRNVA